MHPIGIEIRLFHIIMKLNMNFLFSPTITSCLTDTLITVYLSLLNFKIKYSYEICLRNCFNYSHL